MSLSKSKSYRFSSRLLIWYAKHQRDLPWRRDADNPYRVWVSETLLQQTQVTTVLPYYKRFLARFPTVRALARARLDDVLKTWEGAGYYARARNLHHAAKEIVSQFGGVLPKTVDGLRALPGIGRYTAGAIASIAFNSNAPVLDGNVTRVLCRHFALRDNPKKAKMQKALWKLAEDLIPSGRAGKFNQALMDLGATICTPRNPACQKCPINRSCSAKRQGLQDKFPAKTKNKRKPHKQIGVGVVWKGKKVLIARRFENDLLGGLWEFPGGHLERGESLEECVVRELQEELGIKIVAQEELAAVDHAYSHFSITLHAFRCRYLRGRPRAIGCAAFKWVSPRQLSRYAFPAANRKIIAMLNK